MTDSVNPRDLLDQPAEAFRYVDLPEGHYLVRAVDLEEVTSSQKKTPGYKISFKVEEALEDIPREDLEGVELDRAAMATTFWITKNAMGMLTDFCEKAGLNTGKPFSDLLDEIPGVKLKAFWSRRKDSERFEIRGFLSTDTATPTGG